MVDISWRHRGEERGEQGDAAQKDHANQFELDQRLKSARAQLTGAQSQCHESIQS